MILSIDQRSDEPLYLQIRDQVIEAIARGELVPGQALPSVRSLASDLGLNLHTVNKAYSVLRDEGYVLMRGRSGAYIADPCDGDRRDTAQAALSKMEDELFALALAHRAHGGSRGVFLECAAAQATRAYDILDRPEAVEQNDLMAAAKVASASILGVAGDKHGQQNKHGQQGKRGQRGRFGRTGTIDRTGLTDTAEA